MRLQTVRAKLSMAVFIAMVLPSFANAAPPYAEFDYIPGYKYKYFEDCSTRNKFVSTLQIGVPKEHLEEYKRRKALNIPNDKFYTHVDLSVRNYMKYHSIAYPFKQKFECRFIQKGHALTSGQVCSLVTGDAGSDLVQIGGANYCNHIGGGGRAAIPWLACERYAEKKLKLQLDQTATFARWDGSTHQAECFYFDVLDIERHFSKKIDKLKNQINPEMWKVEKEYAFFTYDKKDYNKKEMFAEILGDKNTRPKISLAGYPEQYGISLLALANSDLDLAIKIANRTWALEDPDYQYYSIDHKGYVRTGNKSNLKQVSLLLEEIRQDRIRDRKTLEQSYNKYVHEKDASKKQKLYENYLNRTRIHNSLKGLEDSAKKLHDNINK